MLLGYQYPVLQSLVSHTHVQVGIEHNPGKEKVRNNYSVILVFFSYSREIIVFKSNLLS
jgi:hypothetical protein